MRELEAKLKSLQEVGYISFGIVKYVLHGSLLMYQWTHSYLFHACRNYAHLKMLLQPMKSG